MSEIIGRKIETGVYPTYTAIGFAEKLGVDLVEITPNAAPPVCRLIDYNKFLYNKKKKEKELKAKTSKTVIKEIRFGPNTDEHDFEFKLKHAKSFLGDESAKVKAYVQFKGRAIVLENSAEILDRRSKGCQSYQISFLHCKRRCEIAHLENKHS